MKVNLLYHWSI